MYNESTDLEKGRGATYDVREMVWIYTSATLGYPSVLVTFSVTLSFPSARFVVSTFPSILFSAPLSPAFCTSLITTPSLPALIPTRPNRLTHSLRSPETHRFPVCQSKTMFLLSNI
ncbi:hypothetical protein J4E86_005841 [Alternaria arbusti]|uniref:uncharacterized protein n=1 Tax=Alternaria arbusti TaxID=232088 RepID=UPI00221F586F|nr:uncharacterized protein J4E86_005841 [Alternaria arbusti]KAI4954532.1 hypothetical protein J4E86_005841 [Alternaria arbusti]